MNVASWLPTDLRGAPFYDMVLLCLGVIAVTWLLSVLTREYSWVDRSWSTVPVVYVGYEAYAEGFANVRLNVMAVLVTLWGARLTFNFARKGGFRSGGEDYRWEVLKKKLGPVGFQFFNLSFISPYQSILILLFCAPAHTAWVHRATPLGILDIGATTVFLLLLAGETIADKQMWRFQQDKTAKRERGEKVDAPFFCEGLYRFSRHPNYFCELGMWWTLYLFAVAASGMWLNWTLTGVVLLSLLFDGSVRFGESISAGKYPSYADYQARVSRLIPWWPKPVGTRATTE